MTSGKSLEIDCPSCGAEALLVRTPEYEGLSKVGDALSCSACGHRFETEEDVPFKAKRTVQVFTDDDRPPDLHVFEDDENKRICRYCVNYVINPFMQWCGLNKKEVQATDSCSRFELQEDDEEEEPI